MLISYILMMLLLMISVYGLLGQLNFLVWANPDLGPKSALKYELSLNI